eukprot:CAMPEP_0184690514 /NCGR_PEP_ID=MMETSP0312-20130426/31269_1 /TAXON_ID=31354 /ORGANISM="Compsopogon coeruleus, Strain SAG 36.94" /LENGTH=723 /DNA_ID=CAMNT_0027148021 /DNA_START=31 /DNA_END=2202 /DNA_ORIENTATION=+
MAFLANGFLAASSAGTSSMVSSRRSSWVRPGSKSVHRSRPSSTVVMVAPMIEKLAQTGDAFSDSCINAIRFLAIDGVEKAKSGHPGMPMGMAPTSYVLWNKIMKFNPKNPDWFNRDRFVLSAGHGSMLQYSMLYLTGYDSVGIEDLKQFRQLGSATPGHPENFETPGVEVTTGPLGQGICNAVGLAMAEKHLAAVYNKPDATLVDHYTYCIMGDGCHMEGVSGEACSLAGHLGLGKLIAMYDDNHISIDGHTDISFTEDVLKRFEAYGWHTIHVQDGNTDLNSIQAAIEEAKRVTDKPTMIKVTTIIGYGSPNKADSHDVHGAALGGDEVEATRKYLGWKHPPFEIPADVLDHFRQNVAKGAQAEGDWAKVLASYKAKYPELGAQFQSLVLNRELPSGWEQALKDAAASAGKSATRQLSQLMLNSLAPVMPNLVGGSADLAPSNLTIMKGYGDFLKATPEGRNLRFGVREHGMGAICNGIALHSSGLVPYCATFFVFTDYMRAAMRISALSQAGVIYIMTHDSVALGEDGPTHQPIEHIASFRVMPNINMTRPADATETAACYAKAIESRKTPTIMALTRQALPKLENGSFEGAKKGAYVLSDSAPSGGVADVLLVATGSEVETILQAAETLKSKGTSVRVVSMPCWEWFEEQDDAYKSSVFPPSIPKSKRLACEAASSFGWARYVDNTVCIDRFGVSAPGSAAMKHLGITADHVVAKVESMM